MPEKHIFDSGTVLLLDPIQTSEAVSVGLWLNLGSRDEKENEHGFSHFTEHMLFKGTEKRSHYDIALEIDATGGEINGATGKESTSYFINAASEHAVKALDILADMYFNSSFEKEEFEKERAVILDEIDMSFDDPDDYVSELYSGVLWGRVSFGLPVIGQREDIQGVRIEDLRHFYKTHYLLESMIISVAGKVDGGEIRREVERLLIHQTGNRSVEDGCTDFEVACNQGACDPGADDQVACDQRPGDRHPGNRNPALRHAGPQPAAQRYNGQRHAGQRTIPASRERSKPQALRGLSIQSRDIEQVYFICGRDGYGYRDENRYAMALFNTILGNSFSSRLFQKVREKLGLCYSISSAATSYSDVGEFSVSFSTSVRNLPRVLDAVNAELKLVKNGDITEEELKMAKRRFRGNYVLAKESNEWKMVKMAMQEMVYGRFIPYDETLKRIEGVTLDEVNRVGFEVLSASHFSIASVGPPEQRRYLDGFQFMF